MKHSARGFTLVELAVVLVIVGLVLGGVLARSQFRANAALQATIADVTSYGAATAIFLDRYEALPGDLREAAKKVPHCDAVAACEAAVGASTTGDGNIGVAGAITRHQTAGTTPAERETLLFWTHLILAELVTGLVEAGSSPPAIAWGQSHPAAPLGGGFHVKDANGGVTDPLPGWPPAAKQPDGTFLVLQAAVHKDLVPAQRASQVLSATHAAVIDRKMDDGNPFDGYVVGYGTATLPMIGRSCFSWLGVDRGRYDQGSSSLDCGLAFRIAP